ncbi:PREDICTED: LOC110750777 [Prunus dulcis]|uniref:PREDICTED: LOC110750777 n=1 Tax=Prunus dulcis TaxID=3755 RepID=A0A5E4ET21_PRUDU|nr:PREDICTED: LOC110750777 [Prunus dulcis]
MEDGKEVDPLVPPINGADGYGGSGGRGEEQESKEAFYGGSDSVSRGQSVIGDQLDAPPLPHGMSTAKILYLCFGEYMADEVLYSIQALRLDSFPPLQTLKAKELAYIRGEGLPLRMGCSLFGSNIVSTGMAVSQHIHGKTFTLLTLNIPTPAKSSTTVPSDKGSLVRFWCSTPTSCMCSPL